MIVQKFGGSSLATRELREIAIGRVLAAARERRDPVVVVSALGRAPSPYSTDALAALVGSAPGSANRDLVLACGELISAGLFAEELCARGVRATALSGAQAGILTDDAHGDAEIVAVRPVLLERLVAEGVVPVVAGFQGSTGDGRLTTIGRGGSDLTAVAVAWSLGNVPLEIYTDVDGVYDADPREQPGASAFERLSLRQLRDLARSGARVMQERAAELAYRTGTSLRIIGLRSGLGTYVGGENVNPD